MSPIEIYKMTYSFLKDITLKSGWKRFLYKKYNQFYFMDKYFFYETF